MRFAPAAYEGPAKIVELKKSAILKFAEEVDNFAVLAKLIRQDGVESVNAFLADPGSQFYRRSVIRTLAAEIEALTFCFKRLALAGCELFNSRLSAKEFECISGAARLPTFQNVKLSLRTFEKILGCDLVPDDRAVEWTWLKIVIETRNRLMHPKSSQDLDVSDREIGLCGSMIKWFASITGELTLELAAYCQRLAEPICFQQFLTPRTLPKVRRNDVCPCGSKRKYKLCCGRAGA